MFNQFFKKFGLHELFGCHRPVSPGSLIAKRFLHRQVEHCGHLSEVFTSMPQWFWDSEADRVNLVQDKIVRTTTVGEDGAFCSLGLQAVEMLPEGFQVQTVVREVTGRAFRVGPGRANKFSLLGLLQNLRASHQDRYRQLEDRWAVLEVYEASAIEWNFDNDVAPDQFAFRVRGGTESSGVEWLSPRRAVLKNQPVPFAFAGFRI